MARNPKKTKMVEEEIDLENEEIENEEMIDEDADQTDAGSTIRAKPSDASRAGMMAQAMGMMASMDKSQLEAVLAQIGHEADNIPDDAAKKNAMSIMPKGDAKAAMNPAIKEDLAELFGSEELTEDFKERTAVLFESAVNAKVLAEVARLEDKYEQHLTEEVNEITSTLTEQIDQYLSYAVSEWIKENEVAIDSSIKADLSESFLQGIANLLAEHYVSIPEEKVDIVEKLAEKVHELEESLNEQLNDNMEMASILEEYTKQDILAEVSEGLAVTQIDKFEKLAETVDYTDNDDYKNKLEIIKEHHFGVKSKPTMINEEVDTDEHTNNEPVVPSVDAYAKAISRTLKK